MHRARSGIFKRNQQKKRLRLHKQYPWPCYAVAAILLSCTPSLQAQEASKLGAASPTQAVTSVNVAGPADFQQLAEAMPQLRAEVNQLLVLTQRQAGQASLELQQRAADPQRSPLERDALVHAYAMALRQLSPAQVDPGSMVWLTQYSTQSWRHHEESASYLVPSFDVAAAIAGTRNEWAYQDGMAAAHTRPALEAKMKLNAYLNGSPAYRHGFEHQMRQLDSTQRQSWRQLVAGYPALAPSLLAGELLLDDAQVDPIASWLMQAGAADGLALLRQARQRFDREVVSAFFFELCRTLLARGADATQCLSQAPMPLTAADPLIQSWQELLLPLLGERELGAGAAQILARMLANGQLSAEQFTQWQQSHDDGLTQQRLQLIAHLSQHQAQLHAGMGEDQ